MQPPSSDFRPLPLTAWGGFRGQRRLSTSPYIESIWEGVASQDCVHLTSADGAIDLALRTRRGATRLLLSGPTSKVRPTAFEAGDEVLAIRLRSGVHLPFVSGAKLTDIDRVLPSAGKHHFWLHSTFVAFPNFNNVETFIEHMVKLGLLQRDIVVEDTLAERFRHYSIRTVQRHFLAATGLTMSHISQIRRAEQARCLLTSNYTLASIAYEAGYSNPGHMTKAFKYFFGRTPSDMRALMAQPLH